MCIKLKNKKLNKQESTFIQIEEYIIPKDSIQYIKQKSNYMVGRPLPPTYVLYYGIPTMSFNKNTSIYNSHGTDGSYESNYKHIELTQKQYDRLMSAIANQIIIV